MDQPDTTLAGIPTDRASKTKALLNTPHVPFAMVKQEPVCRITARAEGFRSVSYPQRHRCSWWTGIAPAPRPWA